MVLGSIPSALTKVSHVRFEECPPAATATRHRRVAYSLGRSCGPACARSREGSIPNALTSNPAASPSPRRDEPLPERFRPYIEQPRQYADLAARAVVVDGARLRVQLLFTADGSLHDVSLEGGGA
ncbi:MAG: hypothetical protein HY722_05570 [Planctomycetes bacterium]|nr:hypothetical protein [Planctomycetota bacterium]